MGPLVFRVAARRPPFGVWRRRRSGAGHLLPRRTGAPALGMTAKEADTPCKRRRSRFDSDLLHVLAHAARRSSLGFAVSLAQCYPGAKPPDPTIGGWGGSHGDPFGGRPAAGV